MKKIILIEANSQEELRVAITKNNKLYNLDYEKIGSENIIGNIYKGTISSIEYSLNAAFISFGREKHGFLPLKEISYESVSYKNEKKNNKNIKDYISEGQDILVQIEKEERGNKGASLTTFNSLSGSYLILMPNSPKTNGISRRIEGNEREKMKNILNNKLSIPSGMGIIIRTAAIGRTLEELQDDLNILVNHWKEIIKAFHSNPSPFLIHKDSDLAIRSMRDYFKGDVAKIIISGNLVYQKIKKYIDIINPNFCNNIINYKGKNPLFIEYNIEKQIELIYKKNIPLPSGGSIVIDKTEALISIDINSSRYTKGNDIEETAFNTNIEAAEEISRQLRLRDIGGLIVIDFIDMSLIKHQRLVEEKLKFCLSEDRARTKIGKISSFGLLEMSRQRLKNSLEDSIYVICNNCNGKGYIKNTESLGFLILKLIEKYAIKNNIEQIQIQSSLDVSTFILNEKKKEILNLEKKYNINILIIPNQYLKYSNYQIKTFKKKKKILSHDKLTKKSLIKDYSIISDKNKKNIEDNPAVKNRIFEGIKKKKNILYFINKLFINFKN